MRIKRVALQKLHSGQQALFDQRDRNNAVRCGRRWGKTRFMEWLAGRESSFGGSVGIFAPEHKQLAEPWDNLRATLDPIVKTANRNDGTIKLITGGKIDFWTLNDNELAGRGREYDLVLIDEAAFTKSPQMKEEIWFKSIKPTLLVTRGSTWIFSTPNGVDHDNFFYAACNEDDMAFKTFHAPTNTNPFIPLEELDLEEKRNHPLVFKQEYMAEFVDWSGVSILSIDKMLPPVEYPKYCSGVFAVMDCAVKGGKEHDGTAVVYCSITGMSDNPLTILDWDIVQIDGALLENWMPSVFSRLDELATNTKAAHGNIGVFIEDTAAGSILLQQGRNRGWNVHAIDSKLTQYGKDERVINISGYVHQEKVKMSQYAYEKVVPFKGATRNHLLSQIATFRIGDPDANKRSDDLLDAVVYSIAIGVGDKFGF
jgi:hypothetical protein